MFMLFVEMVIGWYIEGGSICMFELNWKLGLVNVDMLMCDGDDDRLVGGVLYSFYEGNLFLNFFLEEGGGNWLILDDLEKLFSVYFCDLDIYSELLGD